MNVAVWVEGANSDTLGPEEFVYDIYEKNWKRVADALVAGIDVGEHETYAELRAAWKRRGLPTDSLVPQIKTSPCLRSFFADTAVWRGLAEWLKECVLPHTSTIVFEHESAIMPLLTGAQEMPLPAELGACFELLPLVGPLGPITYYWYPAMEWVESHLERRDRLHVIAHAARRALGDHVCFVESSLGTSQAHLNGDLELKCEGRLKMICGGDMPAHVVYCSPRGRRDWPIARVHEAIRALRGAPVLLYPGRDGAMFGHLARSMA